MNQDRPNAGRAERRIKRRAGGAIDQIEQVHAFAPRKGDRVAQRRHRLQTRIQCDRRGRDSAQGARRFRHCGVRYERADAAGRQARRDSRKESLDKVPGVTGIGGEIRDEEDRGVHATRRGQLMCRMELGRSGTRPARNLARTVCRL